MAMLRTDEAIALIKELSANLVKLDKALSFYVSSLSRIVVEHDYRVEGEDSNEYLHSMFGLIEEIKKELVERENGET